MTHTGVQPVRSAGAAQRHAGWHLGASDCNANYGVDADLHEMEIAIRGVNTDYRRIILALAVLYGTLQLRRRASERLSDTSNDTFLSNTATKGL